MNINSMENSPYAVEKFKDLKQYIEINDFKIGGEYNLNKKKEFEYGGVNGTTLENLNLPPVQTSYITLGNKKFDKNGEVNNAILICPYYSGDSTNMLDFWGEEGDRTDFSGGVYIGSGKVFDTDKYFIIIADALGLWGASRPGDSHPGKDYGRQLGIDFPHYSMFDCVQLMYRMLKDELGVNHLKLVTGVSLGGSLTYAWSVLHPEFMDAILPIGGTIYQDKGMVRWLFDLMTQAIKSDEIYRSTKGIYYDRPRLKQPILGNMFGWSILKQSAFVDELRVKQSIDEYMLEGFDWEESAKVVETQGILPGWGHKLYDLSVQTDANDMIYRNSCQTSFNIEHELSRIKAKTLIIHVETDQWIQFHIAKQAHTSIKHSELKSFSHDFGHYAVFLVPGMFEKEIRDLLE